MLRLGLLKPIFWNSQYDGQGPFKYLFDFRRIWWLAIMLSAGVALVPIIFTGIFDYRVTKQAMETEMALRSARLVSNTRRTVTFFLIERKAALDFIVQQQSFLNLKDGNSLKGVLDSLQKAFGGFTDLGIIDDKGLQCTYVGPYELAGTDYSKEEWFQEVVNQGVYISDVFLGFRNVPHLVIAVRHNIQDGSFYVLRASIDTELFNSLLTELEVSAGGDAFIINRQGIFQTPPRYHGKVLDKCHLPIPQYSPSTRVFQAQDEKGKHNVVASAYIDETPFILLIVKDKNELMRPWYDTRRKLFGFLGASVATILIVILGIVTVLVNKIYLADEKRLLAVRQAEHANKMASIGRLAAGVAHEINNPLDIINQKAGLIKDLFTYKKEYASDKKLTDLVDWIISSVARCGKITQRLLSFARHMEVTTDQVQLRDVVDEVIGLLGKEAVYGGITVEIDVDHHLPLLVTDRGKLQQIFLNLVNNAMAAMPNGGTLEITARQADTCLAIQVIDTGCGIKESDVHRIFEPFFSTKRKQGGTGLGLSITYGLIRELGGDISVESEVGKGTRFTISLPLAMERKQAQYESLTG
jgi:two-component system, NtrC family, sensor kinase